MSQTFAGYVCWSRANVAQTINTEAVHANTAVFLATHRPLTVVRKSWESTEPGEQVDEQSVLDDFVNRRPTGGVVLMAVIGESGTGKSHLVRWVGQHLLNTPTRRVIYLRKTETSLSSVIGALLADLDDPKFQDVRDRVGRSMGQYDERRLPHELLDRLALAVQFVEPVDSTETGDRATFRKLLTSDRGLPTLLRDYEYRKHLLAPDGVLIRFAAELRRGRRGSEGERPTAFDADDLLTDIGRNSEIGPVASAFYRQLTALPGLREEAARLLTENLDSAVLRLADLDGGQLAETMIDIRREFHRRGQEVVLLVEDFALIQGIQRDLLDAISETGLRKGRQELATMRTLMAVTRGYFSSLPETVRTRVAASVPHVYELDVPMGEGPEEVGGQHVIDFVARYVNAARFGEAVLTRAYDPADPSADWVPNACVNCCYRPQCHEAFGVSSEGFGLYPYNKSAIIRAVRVTSKRDEVIFNPRGILARVIRHVLDNYDTAIHEGRFPPRMFRKDFPRSRLDRLLSPEAEAQLRRIDPEDYERRLDLLEFWGDAARVTNLSPGIQEAFRLLPLPSSAISASQEATAPMPTSEDKPGRQSALQLKLNAVDDWYGRGVALPQDLARNLRSWLRQAVVARVSWNDLGLPHPTDTVRKAVLQDRLGNGVSIEGAFGEKGGTTSCAATIVLNKGPETASLFKAIVQRVEYGHWNFSGGPRQQRLLSRRIDEWTFSMINAVREHFGLHQPQTIDAAVEASLLGARLLNLGGSRGDNCDDLLKAVLDPGTNGQGMVATHKDVDARAVEWTKLAGEHVSVRAALVAHLRRAVGAAQGSGGEQIIDATVLLPAIDAFLPEWKLRTVPNALPNWVEDAHCHLRQHFETALHAQWVLLQSMATDYRRLIGDAEPEVLLEALESALPLLSSVAPGAGGRAETLREEVQQARKYPWVRWQQLANDVLGTDARSDASIVADEYAKRLRTTSVDHGEQFCSVLRFLQQCDRWLDEGLRRAGEQRSTQPADPFPELRQVFADISALLDRWGDDQRG